MWPTVWMLQAMQSTQPRKSIASFAAANGDPITNRGQLIVGLPTTEGHPIHFAFQVCEVSRPLWSVSKICDAGCSVTVRVHRKQQNGTWLVVNTTLRTSKSTSDSRSLTLPAGDYKIEVICKQAKYEVSVDK